MLTWLHLSDLHFRAKTQWDADYLLESLIEDIGERIEKNSLKPDLVFVTGDLVHSGKKAEYDLARPFLERVRHVCGVADDRVFTVPGNHDLDRDHFSLARVASIDHLRKAGRGEEVAAIFEPSTDRITREPLFEPLRSYSDSAPALCRLSSERLYWSARVTIDRFQRAVVLLGLNTAWTATGDGDQGRLVMGRHQVLKALSSIGPSRDEVVFALVHHPLGWLVEWDAREVGDLLPYRADFVLRGHLHHQEELIVPGGSLQVAVGSAYDGSRSHNAYCFGRLDLEAGNVELFVRRWLAERGGKWVWDPAIGSDPTPGRVTHPLPERLRAKRSGPTSSPDTRSPQRFETVAADGHRPGAGAARNEQPASTPSPRPGASASVRAIGEPERPSSVVERLVRELATGRVVLFVGAGLSKSAGLPLFNELVEPFRKELGVRSTHSPLLVADAFRRERGELALLKHVREALRTPANPNLANHDRLLDLGCRWIVTTNYDDLFEETLRRRHERVNRILSSRKLAFSDETVEVQLLKVHGDLETMELVLTEDDYSKFFETHRAFVTLLSTLVMNRPLLFIGYSLSDPNILTLLDGVRKAMGIEPPRSYMVTFGADAIDRASWLKRQIETIDLIEGRVAGTPLDYTAVLGRWLEELVGRVRAARLATKSAVL